jgi:MFS family permease
MWKQTAAISRVFASRGVFYGWWIVLAGFVVQMFTSGMGNQSGGLYMVVLQEEFGWTKTFISGVFALGTVQAAALAPLQGRLIDKFGPRAVVRTGIILMGLGLIAVSTINSVATFVVYGLLLGLGFTLAFDVAPQTAVVNWFKRKRGTAMGLMMAGFGAGGALVPGVALAVTILDWRRAVLIAGGVVMVVGLAAAQLLRRSPEEHGLLPDGESVEEAEENGSEDMEAPGFTVRQTLRTPSFWLLALYQALFMFGVTAVAMHLVPYVVESLDVSLATAGSLMTVLTVCIVIGHVLGGYVGDRVNKRAFMLLLTVVQAGVLTLVIFGSSLPLVVVFAVLQGLIVGSRAPLNFSLRADYFGRKAYGTIWGVSLAIVNLGNMAGIVTTGFLADRFGGYREAFVVILALTCLSVLLLGLARRPRPPAGITAGR